MYRIDLCKITCTLCFFFTKMNVSNQSSKNRSTVNQNEDELSDLNFDESALQLIDKPFDPKVNSSNLRTDYKYNGFDSTMGNAWIYPTNYPVRQYQHNISRVSLFKNTLVSCSFDFVTNQLNVEIEM